MNIEMGSDKVKFKPLPIGIDNFEMLITRGYYFVDSATRCNMKSIA